MNSPRDRDSRLDLTQKTEKLLISIRPGRFSTWVTRSRATYVDCSYVPSVTIPEKVHSFTHTEKGRPGVISVPLSENTNNNQVFFESCPPKHIFSLIFSLIFDWLNMKLNMGLNMELCL